MRCSWSIRQAGTCRRTWSCHPTSPSLLCRRNPLSSIQSKTSGRPYVRCRCICGSSTLATSEEETPTAAASHGDAAWLLPVLRLAPLRPQAQLDPPRSPAILGARPATPRSTTAGQLGEFERTNVVQTTVSSHIASSGMKRRFSQKSSGEPSAGNLHAGFCLGRRVQEAKLAR